MGGSVSILPEKLSEDDVRRFTGEQFDKLFFDTLKDEEGFITKQQFMDAFRAHEDKIRYQFVVFCPNGKMDSKGFVNLCRDTKLFDEHDTNVTAEDIQNIFTGIKSKDNGANKSITFEEFLSLAIPALSTRLGMGEMQIMTQIEESTLGVHPRPEDERWAKLQFNRFCTDGEMDSMTFIKLCREKGLLEESATEERPGVLRQEDADIIFQKAKLVRSQKKGITCRSIGYKGFRTICIPAIADKRNLAERWILHYIARGEGPTYNATVAEDVRLHDDKTSYTGTRKTSIAGYEPDVSVLDDPQANQPTTVTTYDPKGPSEQDARDQFNLYCPNGEMDSKAFVKLCKDKGFIEDGQDAFRQADADIIYNKAKAVRAQKKGVPVKAIGFKVFRTVCVPAMAEKRDMTEAQVIRWVSLGDGPVVTATAPSAVRLHDDKTTYTYSRRLSFEGEETGEESNKAALREILEDMERDQKEDNIFYSRDSYTQDGVLYENYAAISDCARDNYYRFSNDAGEMDSMAFVKICRDKGVIDKLFTLTDALNIFEKAKKLRSLKKGFEVKTIKYTVFRYFCIVYISNKKNQNEYVILKVLGEGDGPKIEVPPARKKSTVEPNLFMGRAVPTATTDNTNQRRLSNTNNDDQSVTAQQRKPSLDQGKVKRKSITKKRKSSITNSNSADKYKVDDEVAAALS